MFMANGTISRVVSFKLSPGSDLMQGLINVCVENQIQNGVILCALGSLQNAVVKNVIHIDGVKYSAGYGEPVNLNGPIELVSTSGVICHDDQGHVLPHIHVVLSDRYANGHGGHLCEGTKIQITVEGAIAEFASINMRKVLDVERNIMIFKPEQN